MKQALLLALLFVFYACSNDSENDSLDNGGKFAYSLAVENQSGTDSSATVPTYQTLNFYLYQSGTFVKELSFVANEKIELKDLDSHSYTVYAIANKTDKLQVETLDGQPMISQFWDNPYTTPVFDSIPDVLAGVCELQPQNGNRNVVLNLSRLVGGISINWVNKDELDVEGIGFSGNLHGGYSHEKLFFDGETNDTNRIKATRIPVDGTIYYMFPTVKNLWLELGIEVNGTFTAMTILCENKVEANKLLSVDMTVNIPSLASGTKSSSNGLSVTCEEKITGL